MSNLKLPLLACIMMVVSLAGCSDDGGEKPDDITYDAAYVVNGGDNSISVIDLAANTVSRTIELANAAWPHHIYLNPARTMLAIGVPGMDLSGGHGGHSGMKGKIVLIAAKTGETLRSKELPAMNHNAIFSPDGAEIWTTQMIENGQVLVYDANTLSLGMTIPVGAMPAEITFSADGRTAFVANGESNSVTAIRVADKTVQATIPVGQNPVGAWPGANNKMYVDNEEGRSISVIAVDALTVEETVPLGFTPGMAAYHQEHNELWISDGDNGKAVYFQRMNNVWMRMGDVVTGAGAHGLAFNGDGTMAYVTNQMAGTVSVINTVNKTKIKDIPVGLKPNGIVLKD